VRSSAGGDPALEAAPPTGATAVTVHREPPRAKARSIDDLIADARGAMAQGRSVAALRIAKDIVARDPENRTARFIGVSAACRERDPATARELLRGLPPESRPSLVKTCTTYVALADLQLEADGTAAPHPAAPSVPPPTGTAGTTVDEAERLVEGAIARRRCIEAGKLVATTRELDRGAHPEVLRKLDERVSACVDRRTKILRTPADPEAELWLVAGADELRDAGNAADAAMMLDGFYRGVVITACTDHDAPRARRLLAKLRPGADRDASVSYCKAQGIALD